MVLIAKLIGLWIVGMGLFFLMRPEKMRAVIGFWRQGKRIYYAGGIRVILGSYFILIASQCRWTVMMIAIGILFVAGGISIFVMGPERAQKLLGWVADQKDFFFQTAAAVIIAFGALLLYAL